MALDIAHVRDSVYLDLERPRDLAKLHDIEQFCELNSEKLLILDEPSLGLAPKLVAQIRDTIVEINRSGTSVLLIEQNANMALSIADYGYIMETGKVVMDGEAAKLLKDEDIQEFYLGLHGDEGERKSFRDVKHYKRRKRWLS